MKRLLPRPPKVEHEFTDACLTGLGGLSALARTAAGLGIELPEELRAPDEYLVLPENWDAVRAFLAAESQWRTERGELLGLDYAGAKAAAEGLGIEWRQVFEGVALMEGEALRQRAVSGGR